MPMHYSALLCVALPLLCRAELCFSFAGLVSAIQRLRYAVLCQCLSAHHKALLCLGLTTLSLTTLSFAIALLNGAMLCYAIALLCHTYAVLCHCATARCCTSPPHCLTVPCHCCAFRCCTLALPSQYYALLSPCCALPCYALPCLRRTLPYSALPPHNSASPRFALPWLYVT